MPSGGARRGKPGQNYPNRRDMAQPKLASVGGEYGSAQQSLQSQSAQPLPNMAAGATSQRTPADDTRGQIPSLSDPTANPNEPVTAGLPLGAGAGPEALMSGGATSSPELMILRTIFMKYPNEDLRRMIEWREDNL